jgi:hypothetical protein
MGAGSKVMIRDAGGINATEARVQNFRLWVDATVAAIGAPVDLTVEVAESAVVPATPQLLPIAAEVDYTVGIVPEADGDWTHLRVNAFGMLWVDVLANGQTGDTEGPNPFSILVSGVDSVGDRDHLHLDDVGNLRVVDKTTVNDGDVAPASPELIPTAAVRDDSILGGLPDAPGDWVHLRVDANGAMWSRAQSEYAEGITAGLVAGSLFGVPAMMVRDDNISGPPAHATDGDFTPHRCDSRGIQWVREATMTDHLSGSTNGRPIQITQVATLGDTIHTAVATAGFVDKVWIYLSNTNNVQETVTIEFGAAGAALELDFVVPANDTTLAVAGFAIGGAAGQVITAYATLANVVNVAGYFERHVNP